VDPELKAKLYRGFADPTRSHLLKHVGGGE